MYQVVRSFRDIQDGDHLYEIGDIYPRKGRDAAPDRVKFLLGNIDKLGGPAIEKIETEEAETTEPEKDYSKLLKSEIIELLEEKGIEYSSKATKAELLELL